MRSLWAAAFLSHLAALELARLAGQDTSIACAHAAVVAAPPSWDPQDRNNNGPLRPAAPTEPAHDLHPRNRQRKGKLRRQRRPTIDDNEGPEAVNTLSILYDGLVSLVSNTSLPWCIDMSSTASLPSLTTIPTDLSIATISTTSSSSSLSSDSLSTTSTSGLYTSSSAGTAVCLALSTTTSPAAAATSEADDGDGEPSPTATARANTIIVSPSSSARQQGGPRGSTVTVTAVNTIQPSEPKPSTVGVTETVIVYSTTTSMETLYTTITPRPTAAFLPSDKL